MSGQKTEQYGDKRLTESELYKNLGILTNDKVRMEAPEIFRVLGKRRPEFVRPYLEPLRQIAENDRNRVVRIHCLGAIKAATSM